MKSAKKILALILAGVMALALLTGCGKATSPDRAVAESVADYMKYACSQEGNKNEISVSYQVPELRRDIVPLFDTNWMDPNTGSLDETTVKEALQQRLSNYENASCTLFYATDVTDLTNFAPLEMLQLVRVSTPVVVSGEPDAAFKNATHLRIATTHKTINDHTYALAVVIFEK